MQDKEIDDLFKSGLDSMEIEPSAQVWGNIRHDLDKKNAHWKRYIGIAASLLIFLSAGAYYIWQPTEVIDSPVQTAVVKANKPAKTVTDPVVKTRVKEQTELAEAVSPVIIAKSRKPVVKPLTKSPATPAPQELALKPATEIAQAVQKPATPIKFVVPDEQTPLQEKTVVADDVPLNANTITVPPVTDTKAIAAASVKKRRIRNLGDLINAVVSKVDKRKDKLIEFSDTKDEDESIVSGLNLGFIKIKKQDK